MSGEHVLIVEDEPKIAEVLCDYLQQAGYRVSCIDRGDQVEAFVRRSAPALLVLDVMLPGMEGTEVCREIRKFSEVPILMLTARVEEIDRVLGLELGADDCICKPFSPREVVARVKAVLRRSQVPAPAARLVAGPLTIDGESREASVDGQPLELTPSEFDMLRVLASRPNRVFSRNELLDRVQGYRFEGYDRTIDSHIKNLRRKIARKLPGRSPIHTVYGIGYKFCPDPDR
jgi:two-component system response regulator BaeR